MFSLVLKLHVKYASDLLPVLKASMQGKGVIQELNCEDGGAQGGSYIHISVDKSRGGEKRWSWPIGKWAEKQQVAETLLERRAYLGNPKYLNVCAVSKYTQSLYVRYAFCLPLESNRHNI